MNEVSTLMHHRSTESKFCISCKQQTLVHTAMQKTIQKCMLILGAGKWSCFFLIIFFASSMVHPVLLTR